MEVFMSADEATRMAETLLNLKREDVITKEECLAAIKKLDSYSKVLVAE